MDNERNECPDSSLIVERLLQLEQQVAELQQRNIGVELEKAWETSAFRISALLLVTYLITASVFFAIGVGNFLLNALIPTIGYLLSTQTLPPIKAWWISRRLG